MGRNEVQEMSWPLATCKKENKIILGGLGALGVGVMAFTQNSHDNTDEIPDFPTVRKALDHAWRVTLAEEAGE